MTSVTLPPVGVRETREDLRAPLARLLFGPLDQAAWIRPAFLAVTAVASVVYLWGLTVSGFANTYYSAAALAGSQSWSAWFFGSFDAANFITIDKPPLGTMLMGLSVRLFGLNSLAVLLPEALAGVATVVVLYRVVRRSFDPLAATIAAGVMALTPVAVLIFRYNNPDAILTLLLVAGAGALVRAIETGRLRWVVLAATFVGLAFDAKYLQAYLVLPAFALTYALAAPGGLRRRFAGLVVAAVTVLVTSLWWVVLVDLIAPGSRPYIGGSTTDSAVQLLLGYDGLGRIFGAGRDGGAGGGGFAGTVGILRMFNERFGGQIGWLIPFALLSLGSGLALRRRSGRRDPRLAGYVLWGGWLLVHGLVFSFMSGIIHTYYTVAMAPAVAALIGAGAVDLWRFRARSTFGGILLAGGVAISAWMSYELLGRTPDFAPGLAIGILVVGLSAAVVLALSLKAAGRLPSIVAAGVAGLVLVAGPIAYDLDTMATAHAGGDPSAGPAVAATGGFGGGTGAGNAGSGAAGPGFSAGQGVPGGTGSATGAGVDGRAGFGGGPGGSLSQAAIDFLVTNRGSATWLVATVSSGTAGQVELATGAPVMAMGGFSGTDPTPTLAELQSYIASGQLRFVAVGGGGGPGGNSSLTAERNTWISSACQVVDLGTGSSSGLYDCQSAAP